MQLQGLSPDRDVHMNEYDLRLSSIDPPNFRSSQFVMGAGRKCQAPEPLQKAAGGVHAGVAFLVVAQARVKTSADS